jgi:hypothetical protein
MRCDFDDGREDLIQGYMKKSSILFDLSIIREVGDHFIVSDLFFLFHNIYIHPGSVFSRSMTLFEKRDPFLEAIAFSKSCSVS